jgi:hypothetical protein
MAKVQPITIPFQGIGTTLEVTILSFGTNAKSATTHNRLLSDAGNEVIPNWYYQLTESEFAAWGEDNKVVEGYVATAKGLTIID